MAALAGPATRPVTSPAAAGSLADVPDHLLGPCDHTVLHRRRRHLAPPPPSAPAPGTTTTASAPAGLRSCCSVARIAAIARGSLTGSSSSAVAGRRLSLPCLGCPGCCRCCCALQLLAGWAGESLHHLIAGDGDGGQLGTSHSIRQVVQPAATAAYMSLAVIHVALCEHICAAAVATSGSSQHRLQPQEYRLICFPDVSHTCRPCPL